MTLTLFMLALITWECGWRVALRVTVAGLVFSIVCALLMDHFNSCDDGFGTEFRLFFNVTCP